ncbi:MAG: hypothetical protein CFE44_10595 [Burkholderiales bacterium PBB4]|nr:MAG: hypothetical protein CFE44_10595 [Burkholderiales bacterium PBB4]
MQGQMSGLDNAHRSTRSWSKESLPMSAGFRTVNQPFDHWVHSSDLKEPHDLGGPAWQLALYGCR